MDRSRVGWALAFAYTGVLVGATIAPPDPVTQLLCTAPAVAVGGTGAYWLLGREDPWPTANRWWALAGHAVVAAATATALTIPVRAGDVTGGVALGWLLLSSTLATATGLWAAIGGGHERARAALAR